MAVGIARAAVEGGATVEVVGKVGDDAVGDELVVELERAGIGHAALLRDPASRTPIGDEAPGLELAPPDVELALRYLTDCRVIVVAESLTPAADEVVRTSAAFGGAHRVLLDGDDGAEGGEDATVLRAGPGELTAFSALVGRYAAHLDAGTRPADAFARASAEIGWTAAEG